MEDLREFAEDLCSSVQEYLDANKPGASVEVRDVLKNNHSRLGLCVHLPESNMAPNIYIEDLYDRYAEGCAYEDVVDKFIDVMNHSLDKETMEFAAPEKLLTPENKSKIYPKVINAELNKEYLSDKPYKEFMDLAVVYYLELRSDAEGTMSITITDALLPRFEVSEEELFDLAKENVARDYPVTAKSIPEVLGMPEELFPEDTVAPIVVSNGMKSFGAAAFVYGEETFNALAEKFNSDLYIIPSSVHELLAIPKSMTGTKEEVAAMVKEVNNEAVTAEDFLSNNVYGYNHRTKELTQETNIPAKDRDNTVR